LFSRITPAGINKIATKNHAYSKNFETIAQKVRHSTYSAWDLTYVLKPVKAIL